MKEGREVGKLLMKREKNRAKNGSLRNTSTDSKETTFVILIKHASAPITKERLSPSSKARREASRNNFVGKGRMPDRVKSFREIDSREDRPTARPGFVVSADHQALGGLLTRPKGMEDLAAFKVREVKRAAAEERERDEYSSAEGQ